MESGKTYSLSEIFNKNKRIIIPDLQRDYCWGDTNLVSDFFESLIELYENGNGCYKQISLGLIYAYENPNNFVNIADGQQRITTIYLLLCLLIRKLKLKSEEENVLEKLKVLNEFLVLDNSKNVKEPRLRYEVRESTIYFIKDFINKEIFGKNTEKLTENYIKESNWFRDEYKNDPSIISMLEAIKKMNKKIDEKMNSNQPLSLLNFSYFLLGINSSEIDQKIKDELPNMKIAEHIPKDSNAVSRIYQGYAGISFVYFDVENREFGEKMYVILNTRGAPMEPNEHIKPLLLTKFNDQEKKEWAEKWEDWQDYFWQNKKEDDASADDGFNEFLIWYVKIQEKNNVQKKEKYKYFTNNKTEKTLENIEKYFQALKKLLEYLKAEKENEKENEFQAIFNQINSIGNDQKFNLTYLRNLKDLKDLKINNILIPLLAFMVKFKDDKDGACRFLRRLRKNYFDKLWDYTNRKDKYIKWIDILNNIDNLDNLEMWNDKDEKFKATLDKTLVVQLENHEYLGGRLDLFTEEALCKNFENYANIFLTLPFKDENKILWRALLIFKDYLNINWAIIHDTKFEQLIFDKISKDTIIPLILNIDNKEPFVIDSKMLELKEKIQNFPKWREQLIIKGASFYEVRDKKDDYLLLHNGYKGKKWEIIYPERDEFYNRIKESIPKKYENIIVIESGNKCSKIKLKISIKNTEVFICLEKSTDKENIIIGVLKTKDEILNKLLIDNIELNKYNYKPSFWLCDRYEDSWEENKNNTQRYADELLEIYEKIEKIGSVN